MSARSAAEFVSVLMIVAGFMLCSFVVWSLESGSLMVELVLVCDRWPLERESVDMSMIGAQLAAGWIEENFDQ